MATRAPELDLEHEIDGYRRELTGYCYRMLGSAFEADDAVQETVLRAWRNIDTFEGRSALRSWLYRIATNVCLDLLRGRQRRARPMDLGPASTIDSGLAPPVTEDIWLQPVPDAWVVDGNDPAEVAASRESVRLAFVAALQHLPPKQRAVLILREVLRWHADEVAELLDTSVASVNSALQRARATLASQDIGEATVAPEMDAERDALLQRYVDAFERYDIEALVALLHEDAVQTMPPFTMWIRGRDEIGRFLLGPGIACKGSRVLTSAGNGCVAVGTYRPSGPATHDPWTLQILEISDGRITALQNFLYPELFPLFGLPTRLYS